MNNNYLAHHGIEGQKWGVRNGPPYPLDSGEKAKKASSRLEKYDKKVQKYQDRLLKANKKADRAYNSPFASNEKVAKMEDRAYNHQREYNKMLTKGKRKYDHMVKKYGKENITPEAVEIGKNYTNQLIAQSSARYMSYQSKYHD